MRSNPPAADTISLLIIHSAIAVHTAEKYPNPSKICIHVASGWHSSMVIPSGPLKKAIFIWGISLGGIKNE